MMWKKRHSGSNLFDKFIAERLGPNDWARMSDTRIPFFFGFETQNFEFQFLFILKLDLILILNGIY
jgi:hypothetical protein